MNNEERSLNLAEKLMAARVSKRLSQPELAEKSKIPQSQISKIERAQVADPGFWTILQLAKSLDLSIDELSNPEVDYRGLKSVRPLYPSRQLVIENQHRPPTGMISLGSLDIDDASEHYVGMRNAELNRHLLITGRTGTGKTVLLSQIVRDVARTDNAIILIDPHGALADQIILDLLQEIPKVKERIILLDFSAEQIPSINPLIVHSQQDIEPRLNTLSTVFRKHLELSENYSPQVLNYFQQVFSVFLEANLYLKKSGNPVSLMDVPTFFADRQFRQMILQLSSNPTVRNDFDPDTGPYEQLSDKKQLEFMTPVLRVFQPFGNSKAFSNALIGKENNLDFVELIKNGKIVICKMSGFAYQKPFASFFSSLIANLVAEQAHLWGRQKNPETGKYEGRGCRLFIDEAHNVLFDNDNLLCALAEARKWDFGVIVSTQNIEQFSPVIMESLLANTANKISLSLDPTVCDTMTQAIDYGTDLLDKNALVRLPNYRGYANIVIGDDDGNRTRSGPFLIKLLPPVKTDYKEFKPDLDDLKKQAEAFSETVDRKHRLLDIKSALAQVIQRNMQLGTDDENDDDDDFWGGILSKV